MNAKKENHNLKKINVYQLHNTTSFPNFQNKHMYNFAFSFISEKY